MTRTGRPRPPEAVACVSCSPGRRCEIHSSERDKAAAAKRAQNGKALAALSWAADVPVPFKPISTDLETPAPPSASSLPPASVSYSTPDSGRTFIDAGPMLARAQGRKELEAAVFAWMKLREQMRGGEGTDNWNGVSPGQLRTAEETIEGIAKKLRSLA